MDYPAQVEVRLGDGAAALDELQRAGAASLLSDALSLVGPMLDTLYALGPENGEASLTGDDRARRHARRSGSAGCSPTGSASTLTCWARWHRL